MRLFASRGRAGGAAAHGGLFVPERISAKADMAVAERPGRQSACALAGAPWRNFFSVTTSTGSPVGREMERTTTFRARFSLCPAAAIRAGLSTAPHVSGSAVPVRRRLHGRDRTSVRTGVAPAKWPIPRLHVGVTRQGRRGARGSPARPGAAALLYPEGKISRLQAVPDHHARRQITAALADVRRLPVAGCRPTQNSVRGTACRRH